MPPTRPKPPDNEEVNDCNQDIDLGACYPYVLDPQVRALEAEIYLQPSSRVPPEHFQFSAAAHFHGVSHSQGVVTRFPYVSSSVESGRAPFGGFELVRIDATSDTYCVLCRCKLTQVPLGVSCILLTISCEMLNELKSLYVAVLRPHPHRGRIRIAHKHVVRAALSPILEQAKMDGGTLTVMALVQNCGWWHIYSFQSLFEHMSAEKFISDACCPRRRGDPAITKVERLLGFLQMFKPLTRRIMVHTVSAFQLPVSHHSALRSCLVCLCGGSPTPYVQSRIEGIYPEDGRGIGAPVKAISRKPNKKGIANFHLIQWIADGVMASDPRQMEITLQHKPDGVDVTSASPSDSHFLGAASVGLAQLWNLLEKDQLECRCRLQLKLGPAGHPQSTGSVILDVTVQYEAFNRGVEYYT